MSFDWKKHKAKTDKLLRKSLVSNPEIPVVTTSYKVTIENEIIICSSDDSDCVEIKPAVVKNKKKKKKKCQKGRSPTDLATTEIVDTFRHPKLHTIAKELDANLETVAQHKVPNLLHMNDLTPNSRSFVRGQLTKQLNFKPDEKIYTHLLTLNDSISCLLPTQQAAIRTKRYEVLAKDPEPELSDVIPPEDLIKCIDDDFPDFDYPEISKPGKSNINSLKLIVQHMENCDVEFLMRHNVLNTKFDDVLLDDE
jgi:hypothetical protein